MKTQVMGILNATPDSFSDGGLYQELALALQRIEQMLKEGADIIDIGGESTRPGSEAVSETEELKRVLPIVIEAKKKFPNVKISVDTWKSGVAEECLKAGADMINSLGGFTFDKKMVDVVAKYKCQVVLYHVKGEPKTMQKDVSYDDVILEIKQFFKEQITFGIKQGTAKEQFILDPGIGFGKNVDHNLEIIRRFDEFKEFSLPLLVGVSRKSHLGMILQEDLDLAEIPGPTERVEAGLAEVGVAVSKGASIVRTHDVLQTKKYLAVLDRLQ